VNSARKQGSLSATELAKPKAHLQELVKSDPTNVQALVLQGLLYKNQGSNSMAASLFEQVIAQRSKNMTPDEKPLKKFLRGFGFNFERSDPNLDPRRPENLELDVVQAHIQLSVLQYPENKEAALENLKIAALTYDDPIAYSLLARTAPKYSLEWLEYTRKAAASGHSSAMEGMGEIHSWTDELLKEKVEDERVRDWILNNPLFNAPSQSISLTSLSKAQWNAMRTVKRYEWAKGWYGAAGRQAHDRQNLANYEITRINLAVIGLMESIGQSPPWWIRYERVVSLKNLRRLQTTDGIDATLKPQVQLAVRKLVQDQMGPETQALENLWDRQGKNLASNSDWLREFLKSIDNIPLGKWRSDT
jgi:tetratricopeptide (TPR) repeat protein